MGVSCYYCGFSSDEKPLVQMPMFYLYHGLKPFEMTFTKYKSFICLKCLERSINKCENM